jgi:predicted alpha-1,2-mannosidase
MRRVGLGLALVLVTTTSVGAVAQRPHASTDYASLVDPLIGTGVAKADAGAAIEANTFPGAVAPFGMLSWSPDTKVRHLGGGYDYADSSLIGFSLTHMSGSGGRSQGDVPVLPTVGAIGATPGSATMPFSHAHELATPGSYGVRLGSGSGTVETRLGASTRSGLGQFDFPASTSANLLFKVGDSQDGNVLTDVRVVGDHTLLGSATQPNDGESPGTVTVYFAASFDRPFRSYGFWAGPVVTPSLPLPALLQPPRAPSPCGLPSVGQCTSGAWVTFDTTVHRRVSMKVGISYVSVGNAALNVATEIPTWDLDALRARTRAAWNRLLSRVDAIGGTPAQRVMLYTALYHSLLQPNVFNDVNGEYVGFDSDAVAGTHDVVHRLPRSQGAQYANFSSWDIYRSEFPLLALLAPRQTGDMVQSLLNDQAQSGWLPLWPFANKHTWIMSGDPSDILIAEAYALGVRNFDKKAALAAMLKGATQVQAGANVHQGAPASPDGGQGWYTERSNLREYLSNGYVTNATNDGVPQAGGTTIDVGASTTLEYTSADFAISQYAAALGDSADAKTMLARSQYWTNLWNTKSCFIQPRDLSGAFPDRDPATTAPLDEQYGQNGFQEGSDTQYTWMVPYDFRGLFSAMGGNAKAIRRLDRFFSLLNTGPNRPFYWAGNETDLQAPWAYNYAGVPSKTQAVVRRIISSVYSDKPGGLPGNDDLGSMSSWFVWAALGLYDETPGGSSVVVGAPLFPRVTVHLAHRNLVITAAGAPSTYVQGLRVNGRPSSRSWLPTSLLTDGTRTTTLDFRLGPQANRRWGSAPGDQPPSYSAGPLTFPPGRAPTTGSAC